MPMGSFGAVIRYATPNSAQALLTRNAEYLKKNRAERLITMPTARAAFLPRFVFALQITRAQT